MHIYIYKYIYIYIYRERERERERGPGPRCPRMAPSSSSSDGSFGKGQMGSAIMGSLQFLWFLTEVLFGYSR